jgi:hypothetical protein
MYPLSVITYVKKVLAQNLPLFFEHLKATVQSRR